MVIVLMGPAGAGKSTVGEALAERLGWPFVDADDHHPPANLARMAAGQPLTDEDRRSWLATLRSIVERAIDRREPLVMACSALGDRHRAALAEGLRPVRIVYLKVPPHILRERLAARRGHVARANLLDSQLAALQEPGEPAITVDGTADVDVVIGRIRLDLGV